MFICLALVTLELASADQAGLELRDLPVSASQMLDYKPASPHPAHTHHPVGETSDYRLTLLC